MPRAHIARSLPGHFATLLILASATVLMAAAAGSMYYEAWGQPTTVLLGYVLPMAAGLVLCMLALRRPRAGGFVLLAAAVVLGAWWLSTQVGRGVSPVSVIVTFLVMFGPVVAASLLLLLEARHRRLLREEGATPSPRWLARNYRYVLVAGVPLIAVTIVSATWLPRLLSRFDDGDRGARLVEGNGVRLVWAPQGPGWNRKLQDGAYPSWNMIASYGIPPIGLEGKNRSDPPHATPADMERFSLCAYLDEPGTTLLAEPAHVWRMPTADEIVRSLTRDGENAGCAREAESPHAVCERPPDKETPLWAPDEPPIYYWAADEHDPTRGACVNYTGGFNRAPKSSRSSGYRCVKPAKGDVYQRGVSGTQ